MLDVYLFSNMLDTDHWTTVALPKDLISNYSKIKRVDIFGSNTSTVIKYGNIVASNIASATDITSALTTVVTSSDAAISGVTNDIVIGMSAGSSRCVRVVLS